MSEASQNAPVSIRPAKSEDYDAIVDVWSAAGLPVRPQGRESRDAFHHQLAQFPDLYLVATDGDRIVGVILGTHDHRKGWINRLAVLPEYRRCGLGSALVAACEAAFARHGIEIIAALIEPYNAVSCALVEKLGYRDDIGARYFRKLTRPDI